MAASRSRWDAQSKSPTTASASLFEYWGDFLCFDQAHHWALGGELGVAYTGDTSVSLTRSGGINSGAIDAAVNYEQNKAQAWANQLKWMPVVKLMVTYSF